MRKINKDGWEIKKLNEVCSKGSSNIVISKLEDNEGNYPLFGASGLVKNIDFFQQDKPYIGIVKDGAGVGRVGVYPAHSSLVGTMQYIFPKDNCLLEYIKYFLIKLNLAKHVSGATIPHIYFKDYGQEKIPVPSKDIQQRIVEELDEINAIISAKKEQLRQLDELAQSIFYNMFGDPVNNEMGWEVKTFKQCFSLKSGDGLSAKNFIDGQYPVYGGNGIAGYHNTFNKEGKNIIIGRVGALCGNVHLVEGQIFVTDNAFVLSTDESFEATTLLYLLRFLNLRQFARDALQPVISNTSLKDIKVILPPFPLQEVFAARVSAIEEQKAAIAASIEKMQTLLNERMQEYFG